MVVCVCVTFEDQLLTNRVRTCLFFHFDESDIPTSIFHWLLSCWLPNVLWQILHACAERKHIQRLLEDLDKMGMRLWPLPIEKASYIHHMGTCSENLDCVMLIVTSVQSYIPTIPWPFDKKFINKYEKISLNTNVVFRRSCITMTNQQSKSI